MEKNENRKHLTRREMLARTGLAASTAFFGSRLAGSEKKSRPNIIFFLTDDQRWDMLGCAGHPILKTPNMDSLAHNGVRFLNGFVTTSICAASRATFFTGMYERTHRFTFGTPPIRKKFIDNSYPALLKANGYRTGFVGKFGVAVEKGAVQKMFDFYRSLHRSPYFKKQKDGSLKHLTNITRDEAIKFLRSCDKDKPFCLSVSFNAPHAEDNDPRQYIWPKEEDNLYRDAVIKAPETSEPEFFASQPEFLKKSLNRIRWYWKFDSPYKAREKTIGIYRMISGIDRVIGEIRTELDRLEVADNTIIILMGDNGYFIGERGFAGKWYIYEPSIRVPLIVYDPRKGKIKRGLCPENMALNVDIAPTLLDLAGIPVPNSLEGKSLVPLLKGKRLSWRKDFFYEHLFDHPDIPKSEGVRAEDWTYVRYFEQKPVYEELYDLQHDRLEKRNLVSDEKYSKILSHLRARCDELRDKYGGVYVPWPKKKKKKKAKAGKANGKK